MSDNDTIPKWLFPAISWLLSGYFFYVFHRICGFPLKVPTDKWSWIFLGLSVLFFLAPLAKRIKIGKYFEFEREIKGIKDNISDFKSETRQTLSLISSSINTISNVQNIKIFNVPRVEDIKEADEKVQNFLTPTTSSKVQEVEEELRLEDEDNIMPLVRTRILIEQLLRRILKKRLKSKQFLREVKFLSARKLFKSFLEKYPDFKPLEEAFNYVIRICNAATHGQRIPEEESLAALEMSSHIITVLKDIAGEE